MNYGIFLLFINLLLFCQETKFECLEKHFKNDIRGFAEFIHTYIYWICLVSLLGYKCQTNDTDSRIQGFIRHILNYTEYNQQWNVSQVRSKDSAIICNTTQENIHKYS